MYPTQLTFFVIYDTKNNKFRGNGSKWSATSPKTWNTIKDATKALENINTEKILYYRHKEVDILDLVVLRYKSSVDQEYRPIKETRE